MDEPKQRERQPAPYYRLSDCLTVRLTDCLSVCLFVVVDGAGLFRCFSLLETTDIEYCLLFVAGASFVAVLVCLYVCLFPC